MTLCILKMLYTGCSMEEAATLLPSWSTWNFNSKWLLHMQFGLVVANQNQKTKIKTLYILKAVYTGCSINKQYYCCFHGAPRISK